MYKASSYGPTFGNGYDIYISDNALDNQASYTKCGQTYSIPSGYSAGDCSFFTGSNQFTPTDIEVFYEIGNRPFQPKVKPYLAVTLLLRPLFLVFGN